MKLETAIDHGSGLKINKRMNNNALDYIKHKYRKHQLPFDSGSQEVVVLSHFSRKNAILSMFNDLNFKVGVEVGTERGIYAEMILTKCPGLKLYCVDPWLSYTEAGVVYEQSDFDERYEEAKRRTKDFNCEIIKEKSADAVGKFEDNSLDFVFIDGDHKYEYVLEDITLWHKKVRLGGVMYGHDFAERDDFGVVKAVKEFTRENNISPLFSCHVPLKGNKRGLVDCWMYIKEKP